MSLSAPNLAIDSSTPGTLALSGVLLFDNSAQALAALAAVLPRGGALRLDLTGVSNVDSAGLACVLALMAAARDGGGCVQVVSPPEGLLALAKVSEVDRLLTATAGTE